MPEFSYEIVREIGELSQGVGSWTKQLNLVSWNGRDPKYDIRDWAPEREKMGKGLTLTKAEAKALRDLLDKEDLD